MTSFVLFSSCYRTQLFNNPARRTVFLKELYSILVSKGHNAFARLGEHLLLRYSFCFVFGKIKVD